MPLLSASTVVALGGYELGSGRTVPTVAAGLGLLSVLVAGWVRTRRAAVGPRRGAAVALGLGLVAATVGAVHGANAAGGLGTGNGLAGAIVAVVLGLAGALIAGSVLARAARARRSG